MKQTMKVATLATLLVAGMVAFGGNAVAASEDPPDETLRTPATFGGSGPPLRSAASSLLDLLARIGVHYTKPACTTCKMANVSGDSKNRFSRPSKAKGDSVATLNKKRN